MLNLFLVFVIFSALVPNIEAAETINIKCNQSFKIEGVGSESTPLNYQGCEWLDQTTLDALSAEATQKAEADLMAKENLAQQACANLGGQFNTTLVGALVGHVTGQSFKPGMGGTAGEWTEYCKANAKITSKAVCNCP